MAAAVLSLMLCPALTAQTAATAPSRARAHMAASQDRIWLACRPADDNLAPTLILTRGIGGTFDIGREVVSTPELQLLLPGPDSLMAWMRDGSVYRYDALSLDRGAPERSLPGRDVPLDAVRDGDHVLALITSSAAAALAGAATRPYDGIAGEKPQIIEYDGRDWRPILTADTLSDDIDRGRVALGVAGDQLLLAWPSAADRVRIDAMDRLPPGSKPATRPGWRTVGEFEAGGLVTRIWLTHIGDPACVLFAVRAADGGETLSAYRLLADLRGSDPWRPADLRFSTLPAGPLTFRAAAGFNQQLALLAIDPARESHVIFARAGEPPSEPTIDVRRLVESPVAARNVQFWITQITRILLFGMIIVLFVFRRDSVARVAVLAPGESVGLIGVRLIAWSIDFIPFAIAASQAMDVSTLETLRSLGEWAFAVESASLAPSYRVLAWWALAVGGHTAYALIMELLTRRTVGKTLMGLRVRSEAGGPARVWSVLARNLSRGVELFPPFWVLGFMVVLSRNRQRIGDILARTVIVSIRGPREPDPADDAGPA